MHEIRKATISDAEGVGKILSECYNIKNIEEGVNVFINETNKGHRYIVSIYGNKITGIISWLMHGLPKHGLAELDRIAVKEEFRGKGVSASLFKFMLEEIKKHYKDNNSSLRKLYLLTHEENEIAQKFYEKMGFMHETTLKSHYYESKDEWVMSMFFV